MLRELKFQNGQKVTVDSKAFASGGEGDLYKVVHTPEYSNHVIKIYKPEKRTKERQKKVEYLADNPILTTDNGICQAVVWISNVVYENGTFVGILLPFVNGVKLEFLCHQKLPVNLGPEWQKFDFTKSDAIKMRTTVCFNIAVALYHIHQTGKYLLVDMKPENIIIQPNGIISIIDIDSVAVINKRKIIFKAPVTTPEYTPPEYYSKQFDMDVSLDECWDRFSMTVTFYRLLCGIHPFTGSCNAPFDKCNSLPEMVENGLFPNGKKRKLFKTIPPPHNLFSKLDGAIRQLFIKCFDDGTTIPTVRPSADDWCRVLAPQGFNLFKRKLPSQQLSGLTLSVNTTLGFFPNNSIPFPNVQIYKPHYRNWLMYLVCKVIKRKRTNLIINKVRNIEHQMEILIKEEGSFHSEINHVVADYDTVQQQLLLIEKNHINALQQTYKERLELIDQKAKQLSDAEFSAKQKTIADCAKKVAEAKKEKTAAYESIVGELVRNFNILKNNLQAHLNSTISAKEQELSSLINNPNKLADFTVEKHFFKIFGFDNSDMLSSLKEQSIISAADINGITESGYIKNRSNKWVKVPNIGNVRATKLYVWRNNLAAMQDAAIKKSILEKYQTTIADLYSRIAELENEYKRRISSAEQQYKMRAIQLETRIHSIEKENEESIKELTTTFDTNHQVLVNDAHLVRSSLQSDGEMLNKETKKKIQELQKKSYERVWEINSRKEMAYSQLTDLMKKQQELIKTLN
jgi:serine/threonine protein kinase